MYFYFSVSEIAELVGANPRNVRLLAKGWPGGRKRRKGKGLEYPLTALPEAYQAVILERMGDGTMRPMGSGPVGVAALVPPEDPGPGQERVIAARLYLLRLAEAFCADGGQRVRCLQAFCDRYAAGEIVVPVWVRGCCRRLSIPTLYRWQRQLREGGTAALAPQTHRRGRKATISLSVGLEDFLRGMLVSYPHSSIPQIERAVRARFEREVWPSRGALSRWVAGWKREMAEVFEAVANPDAWKSRSMVAFGSFSEDIHAINDLWELDSTPGDLLLADGRYHLVGVIDVFSRRLKLEVTRTSRAVAILALLRRAMLDWGVPMAVRTDNGKEFTGHYVQRVLADLQVRQLLCPPFQPWHKPYIERVFKTFAHDVLELLPGFCGHNVAERQELRARQGFADRLFRRGGELTITMTPADFQVFVDDWCEAYHHRPHAGLDGQTPFAVAAANCTPLRRVEDERVLDLLLAEPARGRTRVVAKTGIKLDGAMFIAPELEAWVGREVEIRYDPADLGRIYVFDGSSFVCVAVCPERTGVDRRAIAVEAKRRQRARVAAGRKVLRAAAKAQGLQQIAEEIVAAERERAANLVAFPQPEVAHETAALVALQAAVAGQLAEVGPPPLRPPDPEQQARAEAVRERLGGYEKTTVHLDSPGPETPRQQMVGAIRRWLGGIDFSPEEWELLRHNWEFNTPAFKGAIIVASEGGPQKRRELEALLQAGGGRNPLCCDKEIIS